MSDELAAWILGCVTGVGIALNIAAWLIERDRERREQRARRIADGAWERPPRPWPRRTDDTN